MNSRNFKYIFFLFFFSIFSFFSFFYILNINSKNIEKIYMLPLFYGFILIIFNKLLTRIFNSLVFTFLIFGYFFKMVVMPVFLVLGNNYSLVQNILVESNLELAFKLMIYEWFGICFFLYINLVYLLQKKYIKMSLYKKIFYLFYYL